MLREGGWGEANGDLRKYTLQRNLQWKILVWHLYSPNFSDFLQYKKSLSFFNLNHGDYKLFPLESLKDKSGADLGGECRGCAPPPPERTGGAHPPWDDLRFSNTTGSLQKKNYVVY